MITGVIFMSKLGEEIKLFITKNGITEDDFHLIIKDSIKDWKSMGVEDIDVEEDLKDIINQGVIKDCNDLSDNEFDELKESSHFVTRLSKDKVYFNLI